MVLGFIPILYNVHCYIVRHCTGTFFLPLLVGLTSGIVGTVTLLPSLCVGVRRMHDINKSGWYILLVFIPVVGWWVLLKWTLKRGDEQNNLYGHALLH